MIMYIVASYMHLSDLTRLREILQFFCAHDPTLFHPNFGGVPVGPDRPCWGPAARAEALSYSAVKLFSK